MVKLLAEQSKGRALDVFEDFVLDLNKKYQAVRPRNLKHRPKHEAAGLNQKYQAVRLLGPKPQTTTFSRPEMPHVCVKASPDPNQFRASPSLTRTARVLNPKPCIR